MATRQELGNLKRLTGTPLERSLDQYFPTFIQACTDLSDAIRSINARVDTIDARRYLESMTETDTNGDPINNFSSYQGADDYLQKYNLDLEKLELLLSSIRAGLQYVEDNNLSEILEWIRSDR